MARLYQDVLLKRLPLDTAAGTLSDIGQRQFAYEMAVCVCEADGRMSPAERAFLEELKRFPESRRWPNPVQSNRPSIRLFPPPICL
jgi:hypothetical protein